jgi:lambda repressor-like predicted transcriptional regulator
MDRNPMDPPRPLRDRPISRGRYPRIDAELDARGWTVADLCRAAGISYARVTRALYGYSAPSNDTQLRTAAALSCKPWEIWEREPEAALSGADRG